MIEIRPPEELLQPCRMPEPEDMEMNGDVLELLITQSELLRICAGKVEAIIKFYGGNNGNNRSD